MTAHQHRAPGTRFRERVGEDGWAALRNALILTCRAIVGPANDWSVVERRLGALATVGARDDFDLVAALLDDLADPAVRRRAIAETRSQTMTLSEPALRQATVDAARLVDRTCPGQSFAFRAGLTLISLWVADGSDAGRRQMGERRGAAGNLSRIPDE